MSTPPIDKPIMDFFQQEAEYIKVIEEEKTQTIYDLVDEVKEKETDDKIQAHLTELENFFKGDKQKEDK